MISIRKLTIGGAILVNNNVVILVISFVFARTLVYVVHLYRTRSRLLMFVMGLGYMKN